MRRLALALALLPLAAYAQVAPTPAVPPTVRTIDMTQVIDDLHGKPMIDDTQRSSEDPQCAKCGPLTLGTAVAAALLADRPEDRSLSTVDKARRGALALRLLNDKAAALTSAEAAEIVKLASVLNPIAATRVVQAIDPAIDLGTK